jgi:hypothetical protein
MEGRFQSGTIRFDISVSENSANGLGGKASRFAAAPRLHQ